MLPYLQYEGHPPSLELRKVPCPGVEVTRLDDGRNFEAMKMAMQDSPILPPFCLVFVAPFSTFSAGDFMKINYAKRGCRFGPPVSRRKC